MTHYSGGSLSPQPDNHLFQRHPKKEETYRKQTVYCWASSLESYNNYAGYEYQCLRNNGQRAKFKVTVNILRKYFIYDVELLRKQITKFLERLRFEGPIVAYVFLEVTRDKSKTIPIDKIHLHFLVNNALTNDGLPKVTLKQEELVSLFQRACKAAGYRPEDHKKPFVEDLQGLSEKDYLRELRYFLKYNMPNRVILFKTGLLHKKYRVGKFWIAPYGKPIKQETLWEPIAKAWRERETANPIPFTLKELGIQPAKRKPATVESSKPSPLKCCQECKHCEHYRNCRSLMRQYCLHNQDNPNDQDCEHCQYYQYCLSIVRSYCLLEPPKIGHPTLHKLPHERKS